MKNLLIVESPTKVKSIEKFLGKDYKVLASVGHVRDLMSSSRKGIDVKTTMNQYGESQKIKKKSLMKSRNTLKMLILYILLLILIEKARQYRNIYMIFLIKRSY